jgi:endonuclease YncB( thermonuclease family)
MGQPFGDRSTRNLAGLVHSKEVKVECPKKEMVCKVWVQPADCPRCGKTLDVGYAQISVGLAWWNRAYAKEQSDEDRGRYESEEEDARLRKRGLWRDAQPIPPWQWRAERRKN